MRQFRWLVLAIIIIAIIPLSQAAADPPSIILYCNHWNCLCHETGGIGCYIRCDDWYYWCEDSEWTAWHDDWFCQANEDPCEGALEGDTCIASYRLDRYFSYRCYCEGEPVPLCELPGGWEYGGWDYYETQAACLICP